MCWLVILHCFGGVIHYVIILTSVVTSFWVGPRLIATSLDFFTLFWNLWIMLQLFLRLKTDCEISTPHNQSFSIALKSLITQQTHNPTCVDLHLFVVAAVSLCLHSFSCWKCKPNQVLKNTRTPVTLRESQSVSTVKPSTAYLWSHSTFQCRSPIRSPPTSFWWGLHILCHNRTPAENKRGQNKSSTIFSLKTHY